MTATLRWALGSVIEGKQNGSVNLAKRRHEHVHVKPCLKTTREIFESADGWKASTRVHQFFPPLKMDPF